MLRWSIVLLYSLTNKKLDFTSSLKCTLLPFDVRERTHEHKLLPFDVGERNPLTFMSFIQWSLHNSSILCLTNYNMNEYSKIQEQVDEEG